MKITTRTIIKMIVAGVLIFGVAPQANAAFLSGSTGADGALNISLDTALSLPPSGIFNFTTVNIATGTTLTFTRNGANTPVYILATGNVVIDGTISVDGQPGGDGQIGQVSPPGGAGGPGGWNGGQGGYGGLNRIIGSWGLGANGGIGSDTHGEGGGRRGNTNTCIGSFCVGGSGGGGGSSSSGTSSNAPTGSSGGSGGGGGGTIIIASSGTVTINGSVQANAGRGGNGADNSFPGGGGSGGFIRIVATKIMGTGFISSSGGNGGTDPKGRSPYYNPQGKNGAISLEALTFLFTGTTPNGYSFSAPSAVIPPNLPTLKITSVGGQAVPANAGGNASTIDVTLPSNIVNPVPVIVSAANIPPGTYVYITVKSASGGYSQSVYKQLSGTNASSSAEEPLNLPSGVSIVEAYTSPFTVTASLAPHLPMIGGEPVDQIKVGSVLGGEDKLALVTKSGREVPARWIAGTLVPLYEEEGH